MDKDVDMGAGRGCLATLFNLLVVVTITIGGGFAAFFNLCNICLYCKVCTGESLQDSDETAAAIACGAKLVYFAVLQVNEAWSAASKYAGHVWSKIGPFIMLLAELSSYFLNKLWSFTSTAAVRLWDVIQGIDYQRAIAAFYETAATALSHPFAQFVLSLSAKELAAAGAYTCVMVLLFTFLVRRKGLFFSLLCTTLLSVLPVAALHPEVQNHATYTWEVATALYNAFSRCLSSNQCIFTDGQHSDGDHPLVVYAVGQARSHMDTAMGVLATVDLKDPRIALKALVLASVFHVVCNHLLPWLYSIFFWPFSHKQQPLSIELGEESDLDVSQGEECVPVSDEDERAAEKSGEDVEEMSPEDVAEAGMAVEEFDTVAVEDEEEVDVQCQPPMSDSIQEPVAADQQQAPQPASSALPVAVNLPSPVSISTKPQQSRLHVQSRSVSRETVQDRDGVRVDRVVEDSVSYTHVATMGVNPDLALESPSANESVQQQSIPQFEGRRTLYNSVPFGPEQSPMENGKVCSLAYPLASVASPKDSGWEARLAYPSNDGVCEVDYKSTSAGLGGECCSYGGERKDEGLGVKGSEGGGVVGGLHGLGIAGAEIKQDGMMQSWLLLGGIILCASVFFLTAVTLMTEERYTKAVGVM